MKELPSLAKKFRLAALAVLGLAISGGACLQAQMVTVNPVEAPGPLSNPLMGFRPDIGSASSRYAYPTLVRHYIRWNQIENNQSDTVQKIKDYCNAQWTGLPANNQKVIPRVYIDWDSATGNEYWPADLQTGDWTSQAFKDRVVRLIGRLGEAWDNDPRVAWVQIGIIGYWGEQENPVSVSQDGWAQRLGDAFKKAFKNKKFLVRNMNHFTGYEVGAYWDSFAHPSQPSVRNTMLTYNVQGRYLSQVMEGEVAYNWGESTFDPKFGGEPEITLNSTTYTDNMIDVIRELHCSALGWIASYKVDGSNGSNPDTVKANAARVQKEFGYRFLLTEFSCSARTEPGANLNVNFKVKNIGVAPFYENWPISVVLINQATRKIVWQSSLTATDTRTWVPGDNYSYTTRTYQTPAPERQITASVTVPATFTKGEYLVGLSILEPSSSTPGVFFAVPNFFKESQSQPLCRIGIGVDASSNTLTGISFDDLVNDDTRYYTLDKPPTITTQPQSMTVAIGGNVQFSVTASGTPSPTYQWFVNGAPISGGTGPTLSFSSVRSTDAATYTCVITNTVGATTSAPATLTLVAASEVTRLSNLSVRTTLAADERLIVGFTMQGGAKPLLVRAAGPGLGALGVPGTMADPRLALFSGPTQVAANDNWGGDATLAATMASVGAFSFPSAATLDAALVRSIEGSYTAQVSGPAAGNVIVEAYDAGSGNAPRLTNLSALNRVGTGADVLIAGFTLSGATTKNLLIRAVGPSLTPLNVTGVLADPKLAVYNSSGVVIAENDTFAASLAPTFASVGAFALTPGSKDAALTLALPPGSYTIQVSGADGGTGNAIIELYELP